jgi:hypothetical protein
MSGSSRRVDCILDVLAMLRSRRLSPFDLVLEILNEGNPQYSYHRAEFYKDGNQKLFRILDVILAGCPDQKACANSDGQFLRVVDI